MKKTISLLTLFASTALFTSLAFGSNTIAEALGWKTTPSPDHKENLCGGYYSQPLFIERTPTPPPFKTVPVTVTAKGPVVFRVNGASILQDDVVIRQPGRIIHADKAFLYHNKKTGKITDIKLIGHVRIQEDGKLLVGDNADYDVAKNTLTMNHGIYHIAGEYELLTVSTPFDAWGIAKKIYRRADGNIDLTDAQYSTCSPAHPSWVIQAKKIQLDRTKGEGYAHDVVIRFKHVPIFYSPYYSFPITSARKSGFLIPKPGYSTDDGFFIAQPYYWNIAPNYDLLFTPEWYSKRGMQLNGTFRYLTSQSDGVLTASVLPHDSEFVASQQYKLSKNANSTQPNIGPYLSDLRNSGATRAYINFDNNVNFNDDWTGKFDLRYVSDPYYAEDFQTEDLTSTTNQLPSLAELSYAGDHWNNTFLIQSYQTLHPLNQYQFASTAQNQYTRLPEWDFNAAYPDFLSKFNFNLNGQAVHFDYQSAYAPYTYQLPIGNRLHLQPSISRPFTWSSFYITPKLTADTTSYYSQLATTSPALPRTTYDVNRTLPIFDIDSGLYFDRLTTIGGTHYIQTLQPRFFYLYTPYLNQNSYPNFDTQLLPFSISNLYTLNQFSGFDRLQNANQISVGLTSHLLRSANASNILTAQMGVIDYFEKQRVCLTPQSCPSNGDLSPIAGALTWTPSSPWSFSTQAAWDTVLKQINNAQAGVQYTSSMHHILLLNYQFAHGNPDTPFNPQAGLSPDSSLLTAGLVWPVTKRWAFFGYTYYDLTNRHPQNEYVGLSYDTCCWALRFILSSDWNGTTQIPGSPSFQSQYTTTYYLEFALKGLTSIGYNRAESMLTSTLPGFSDVFSNDGHYGYGEGV